MTSPSPNYCCLGHALADGELPGAAGAAARWAVTVLAPDVERGAPRWCGPESAGVAVPGRAVAA
jgi:hypothetical protein